MIKGDVGAGLLYRSLMGTFALYEDAAVLTHQNTVRKDRRLHQGPKDYYMAAPTVYRKGPHLIIDEMFTV